MEGKPGRPADTERGGKSQTGTVRTKMMKSELSQETLTATQRLHREEPVSVNMN